MIQSKRNCLMMAGVMMVASLTSCSQEKSVEESADTQETMKIALVRDDASKKVDVLVDGKLFTAYIYPDTIAKPVLYPIQSAAGNSLTRGYPLDPRPGERVDHPHHIGHWFNFGDVNGLDFWNNSSAIPIDKRNKYGSVVHTGIQSVSESANQAELAVTADWKSPDGTILLKENTQFIFKADSIKRVIERITTLTAQDREVKFTDNKEGMFAIRVARELEHPSDKPEIFTDASGIATAVPTLNNEGVVGKYRSSEGLEGDAVWGTRGNWVNLTGEVKGEKVALVIVDHPSNPGYPTYWHARGYGLFAANTLGQKALSDGKDELNLKLAPGESVTFKYEILVYSDAQPDDSTLKAEATSFGSR
jgi:hypothetical protein